MRSALGALLLIGVNAVAAPAPLRFAITDSWAMPMVQIEQGQPTQGILYDVMLSLATQLDLPAEFHVLARARLQSSMEHAEIDIRCFASQSWLPNQSGDYIWSIPLWFQRDLLVTTQARPAQVDLPHLASQSIGTVLGYSYPTLQPQFDSHQLRRDDARSQDQVLQKLLAGRNDYAISNQWALDWFNQRLEPQQHLRAVAVVQEQAIGCYVRNDPKLPVQRILRTLLRMKMSGEIDDIIRLYTGEVAPGPPSLVP